MKSLAEQLKPTSEHSAVQKPKKAPRYLPLKEALSKKLPENAPERGPTESAENACSGKLETVEEDGFVKKIIYRCSCGETVEIDCQYHSESGLGTTDA